MYLGYRVLVFNATPILQLYLTVSFTGEGNRSTQRKPSTCCKSLTNFMHNHVSSTLRWKGFELTMLVAIGTDCTGSFISNSHTITITTALLMYLKYSRNILFLLDWVLPTLSILLTQDDKWVNDVLSVMSYTKRIPWKINYDIFI